MKPTPVEAARALLYGQAHGVLATLSLELPGYPFGSVTPYGLDSDGVPLIWVSGLAQHTKNMRADGRVSLTLHDGAASDVQAAGRLTWVADARPVETGVETARDRYALWLDAAGPQMTLADFAPWRLEPRRVRYVGGFGVMGWIEPDQLVGPDPLAALEADVVRHMNEDHGKALLLIARRRGVARAESARMVGLNRHGCTLVHPSGRCWVAFANPAETAEAVRAEMVRLTKDARE